VFGKAMLILIGVLVGLALAEVGARILGTPFDKNVSYQCDRLVGWRGTPNFSRSTRVDEYEHEVIRNSRGMHDDEHETDKPDGTYRILILGDSFVEASEVEQEQTVHQILEDALNSHSPVGMRFEVIVGGIRGWGPAQELLYFRTEEQAYAPDLVLVFWYPKNDLQDILPDYRRTHEGINCYTPYFAICDGRFDPEPWFSAPGIAPAWKECSTIKKTLTRVLNHIYYNSRLYQHLEPLLAQSQGQIELDPWWLPWVKSAEADEILSYAYQLTDGIYSQLVDEVAQIGARTAFVVATPKEAVRSEVDPVFREQLEAGPALGDLDPVRPNQIFTDMMTKKGLPVLDLQPHLISSIRESGESLYWETDGHWNIDGNRVAAELMANWLLDQGIVSNEYWVSDLGP
jgi:stress-induced morphogen